MAAPDYAVLEFDLAIARDRVRIVEVGKPYDAVAVLDCPAGVVPSLAFGDNKQLVELRVIGQSFDICLPASPTGGADEGLFLSNPPAAGILRLLVSYAGVRIGAV